jgi:DNA topoisomerase-2
MVMAGLSVIGRNYYGIFPLKGKVLNVREANVKQITDNEEISNLKKIIGLRNDLTYQTEEEFNTLRYGRVIILTDQDHDGSHIKGLVMNLFHFLWPKLLERKGFLTSMNTPIVKATKKGSDKGSEKVISFYTLTDYEEWKEKNNNGKGYEIKYYKGLGTSDNKEAKEYFKDLDKSIIEYDWIKEIIENTEEDSETKKKIKKKNTLQKNKTVHTVSDEAIELAFSKELADKRKDWLMTYNPKEILDSKDRHIPIPEFIHKDLKHFSNDDTQRSIPSVIDGFKQSQRKVLHGAFLRGLEKDQVKVAQLAGFVSDRVAYHHGEASLMGAIIGMAQDYMGSNNINVLEPKGQFGSRGMNGKDSASPRYIWTKIEKMASLVFRKEDNPILNYLDDDGMAIEPDFFLPIIPMILVNGAVGIGTGFSTNIPAYHPVQIIDNILELLNNNTKIKKIHPWYRKFKGSIKKLDKLSYQILGNYTVDKKKNTINITELPVGEATQNYREFLEKLLDSDKDFLGYDNHNDDENINMTLRFKELPKNIEEKLKLNKKISITNLHGYTSEGHIQKFNNIEEIVMEFYKTRLDGYVRRREYLLNVYLHQLQLISYRVKFIKEIINKTLIINNKPKKDIESELEKKKYPKMNISNYQSNEDDKSYDYLLGMNLYSLTLEKVKELENQEKEKQTTYDTLKKKTAEDIWKEELEELKTELLKNKLYY